MTEELAEDKVAAPLAPGVYVPDEKEPMGRSFRAAIRGFQGVSFFFDEPGGPDHLVPGRPLQQQKPVDLLPGDSVIFALMGCSGAFVAGNSLRERPLGQFMVDLSFARPNFMVCRVRLTDQNADDPIKFFVNAVALFFQ
jgi:hypothetical protein